MELEMRTYKIITKIALMSMKYKSYFKKKTKIPEHNDFKFNHRGINSYI